MQGRIICNHLKELNITKVQCFQNGNDALDNIRSAVPDLVVSCMYLPDMTGTDLVKKMREENILEEVPFMLISSETSFASLDPIRQAGVIAILPKPFDPADLKRALYSTLEFINPDEAALADIHLDELHVLVVDDSSMARKHISRVLNNLGIEDITQAEDGSKAVKLIENEYYDMVVTDYNMPEMDGEALTRYIREHSTQRSIPILMVTSESSDSRLSAVQQSGVSGICDKPFDPQTVKQIIRNMFAAA
jgi:two-component system chemotaxis response regulator CheY